MKDQTYCCVVFHMTELYYINNVNTALNARFISYHFYILDIVKKFTLSCEFVFPPKLYILYHYDWD